MPNPDETLETALDATHDALVEGRFEALPALTELTESLFSLLDRKSDAATLARIKQKAARNAECLKAATRGMKAARQRLKDVTSATTSLGTYDREGRRDALPDPQGQLRQRF